MKKLFVLFLIVLYLSGCVSISTPAILNKSFPSSDKYEILGQIGVGGTRYNILGLFWWGGVQWLDLRDEANHKFGPIDDVVSVSVDKEIFSVLGIVTREHFIMRGIAIRYVKAE